MTGYVQSYDCFVERKIGRVLDLLIGESDQCGMVQVPEGYILIKQEEYDEPVERNTHLEDLVLKLVERIDELEARLNKNSTNSPIPPSKDESTKPYRNKDGAHQEKNLEAKKGTRG